MSESTPIRVAQMMTDMNYGGVEMVVMNYYSHIDRSKVQFDFFALEGSAVPQQEEIERLGGHVYLVPRYTHLVQYERAIMELFRKNQYQIVHSHMNTLGVFSLWGAQRAGVPNRIMHNHSVAGKGETKKNFVKYLLRPFAKNLPHPALCLFEIRWALALRGFGVPGLQQCHRSGKVLFRRPEAGSPAQGTGAGRQICGRPHRPLLLPEKP